MLALPLGVTGVYQSIQKQEAEKKPGIRIRWMNEFCTLQQIMHYFTFLTFTMKAD